MYITYILIYCTIIYTYTNEAKAIAGNNKNQYKVSDSYTNSVPKIQYNPT